MMNSLVESLQDELGPPLINWDGATVQARRQPIVYLWLRGDAVLYIGQSACGLQRPLSTNHDRLRDIEATDELVVFSVKTAKLALLWEERLIRRLTPQLNGPGRAINGSLSLTALENEERFLKRQLEGVQRQISAFRSGQASRELRQRAIEDKRDSLFIFDCSNPQCLSPQRAANRYSVRAGSIRAAVRAGTLRAIRFGVYMRFRPEWIEEWLMRRELKTVVECVAVSAEAANQSQ